MVAVLLDPGNLLAVMAMVGFVAFEFRQRWLPRAALIAALGTGFLLAQVLTESLVRILGVVDYAGNPQDVLFSVKGLAGPMVWGETALFAMLPPTKGYLFPTLSGPAHIVAAVAGTTLATAGIVGAAAAANSAAVRRLAAVGLTTLVVGGPFLVVVRFVLGGTYFPIPARYGLCIVPVVAVACGEVFRRSWFGRVLPWLTTVALIGTATYALL
jgi:hypothetical protein